MPPDFCQRCSSGTAFGRRSCQKCVDDGSSECTKESLAIKDLCTEEDDPFGDATFVSNLSFEDACPNQACFEWSEWSEKKSRKQPQ